MSEEDYVMQSIQISLSIYSVYVCGLSTTLKGPHQMKISSFRHTDIFLYHRFSLVAKLHYAATQ